MVVLKENEIESRESREPSPAAAAEQRENVSAIMRLLDTLPANQQEVIRLKFQNGLSYQEISRVTHLTVSNVGFLIHSAIKTIRQRLSTEASTKNPLRSNV